MSKFTTPLIMEHKSEDRWILKEEVEFHVGKYPSDEVITVPEGFDTDLASIPKLFWNILPPHGKYGKAAVVHDYCYRTACYDRKKSDEIFLDGMKVLKVAKLKRRIIYYAVRWFGKFAWDKRREEQREHGQ